MKTYNNVTASQFTLVDAIAHDNVENFKNLLETENNPAFIFTVTEQPDSGQITERRHSLLTWAIVHDRSEIVAIITQDSRLEFLMNLVVDGMTPLAHCFNSHSKEHALAIVEYLLAANADPTLSFCPATQEMTTLQYLLDSAQPLKAAMLEKLIFTGLSITPTVYKDWVEQKTYPTKLLNLLQFGKINFQLKEKQDIGSIFVSLHNAYIAKPSLFVAYVQHIVNNVHITSEHNKDQKYAYNLLDTTQLELLAKSVLATLLIDERYEEKNLQLLFSNMATCIMAQTDLNKHLILSACYALFVKDEHSKKMIISCCQNMYQQHDAVDTELNDYYFSHKAEFLQFLAALQLEIMQIYLTTYVSRQSAKVANRQQPQATSITQHTDFNADSDSDADADSDKEFRLLCNRFNNIMSERRTVAYFFQHLQENPLLNRFPQARSLAIQELAVSLAANNFKRDALELFQYISLKGQSPELKDLYNRLDSEVKGEPAIRKDFVKHATDSGISFWTKTKYDQHNRPNKLSVYWTDSAQPEFVQQAFATAVSHTSTSVCKNGLFTKQSFKHAQLAQAEQLVQELCLKR